MPSFLHPRAGTVLYLASICVLTVVFTAVVMRWQTVVAAATSGALHNLPAQSIVETGVVAPAAGNTITVNTTLDVADSNDGLCTLRESIIAANSNTAQARRLANAERAVQVTQTRSI